LIGSSTFSYPLAIVLVGILACATFLGYEHDLTPGVVAGIYSGILSGVLVGHYTVAGSANGNNHG
jgi:hypothetical protein